MALTVEQQNYFAALETKAIPTYMASPSERVRTAATNLEWNARKFRGEVPGESLDAAEYVRRTRYDLNLIHEALPADAEGKGFAASTSAQLDAIFGLDTAPAAPPVDIHEVLARKAQAHPEKLDWKTSIVDLLKLVNLDHGHDARREFAVAMGYPEDKIDEKPSAEVNTWLHGQLLDAMAHNGGEVPDAVKTARV